MRLKPQNYVSKMRLNKKQALLDTFDFHAQDPALTEELVDTVDERIAALNARRYSMRSH